MKRVLILTNSYVGLYNFRFEIIQKMLDEGYKVYLSAPQSVEIKKKELMIDAGAEFIQTPMSRRSISPFKDLKLIKEYIKIIKKVDPNIILTYTIKPNIYGTYAASRYNKPVIMNITGLGSSFTNVILRNIVKQLYKYVCKKIRLVFFQNEANRSLFISNDIVDHNKTKLIPGSGVNITKFTPLTKEKRDEMIRILFIGRIMKEKGIEEYLEVAKDLSQKFSNIEFQILGSFQELKYKSIIENNTNKNIIYLGRSDDVRKQIKETDCIVNPSYHEGMSNVLLEGAAMGKPLIASNIPGCKEIIEDGYNGYLFEVKSVMSLKDKLAQFIELSKEEREFMGRSSRKKVVNEFDRSIVIDKYMRAISDIIDKG